MLQYLAVLVSLIVLVCQTALASLNQECVGWHYSPQFTRPVNCTPCCSSKCTASDGEGEHIAWQGTQSVFPSPVLTIILLPRVAVLLSWRATPSSTTAAVSLALLTQLMPPTALEWIAWSTQGFSAAGKPFVLPNLAWLCVS